MAMSAVGGEGGASERLSVAAQLRARRVALDLTTREVSEEVHELGGDLSPSYLTQLELGKGSITAPLLVDWATVLGFDDEALDDMFERLELRPRYRPERRQPRHWYQRVGHELRCSPVPPRVIQGMMLALKTWAENGERERERASAPQG